MDQAKLDKHLLELGFIEDATMTFQPKPQTLPKFKLANKLHKDRPFEITTLLVIAPSGSVIDVVVLCSDPFGILEAPAIQWAATLKFSPLPPDVPQGLRRDVITHTGKLSAGR